MKRDALRLLKMKSRFIVLSLLTFALFVLSACDQTEPVSSSSEKDSNWTHVLNKTSVYYKGGPQQASPPDGEIHKGTQVRIVSDSGSYSLIEAVSGESGYVESGSLTPIDPD